MRQQGGLRNQFSLSEIYGLSHKSQEHAAPGLKPNEPLAELFDFGFLDL